MAAESILTSTKQILGLEDDYTVYDLDIITHINTAFGNLNDFGMGPVEGFAIEDGTATWDDYITGDLRAMSAKTYIYLAVRLLFDPPQSQVTLNSMKEAKTEMEWRITSRQERTNWVPGVEPETSVDPWA